MKMRLCTLILSGLFTVPFAALTSPPQQSKRSTPPPPKQSSPATQPAPKTAPTKTQDSPEPAEKAAKPEAPNAGLCKELKERAADWDRIIVMFAKQKAAAETELANCRLKEKEGKALPHQCDQFEEQIGGLGRELKKSEDGKLQIKDDYERYKCQ